MSEKKFKKWFEVTENCYISRKKAENISVVFIKKNESNESGLVNFSIMARFNPEAAQTTTSEMRFAGPFNDKESAQLVLLMILTNLEDFLENE